jgi:hypothetical protein
MGDVGSGNFDTKQDQVRLQGLRPGKYFGQLVERGPDVRGFGPAAPAVSLTDEYQLDVPPCWRRVPPAAPQPGQARTGAVSVAYTRAEQFVFNLGMPIIAGVNG